jgi:hypothetical protein
MQMRKESLGQLMPHGRSAHWLSDKAMKGVVKPAKPSNTTLYVHTNQCTIALPRQRPQLRMHQHKTCPEQRFSERALPLAYCQRVDNQQPSRRQKIQPTSEAT